MKIIEEANWKKKHSCRNCNTKFEYDLGDVRYGMYSANYEDVFEGKFYVACPTCGKEVIQKYLPAEAKTEIERERAD